jgi:hypothetical protein
MPASTLKNTDDLFAVKVHSFSARKIGRLGNSELMITAEGDWLALPTSTIIGNNAIAYRDSRRWQ